MGRSKGPDKGNPFEREIAKRLSLWWSVDNNNDNIFWRTTQSGGRATTRAKAGKEASLHCGDICALDPIGDPLLKVINFELKRGYNKAVLHDLLDMSFAKQETHAKNAGTKKEAANYITWVTKAERDRKRSGALYWAIIHKRDYREELLVMQGGLWDSLPSRSQYQFLFRGPMSTIHLEDGTSIIIVQLKDFFAVIKPEDILTILENTPNKPKQTAN